MRKTIGDANKKARDAAVSVLVGFKGKNVHSLKNSEITDLMTALLQLLGLADASGNIK
jgi:hypothetical protein